MTNNDRDFVKVQRYLLCHFIHFKYHKAHTLRHKVLTYLHNANDNIFSHISLRYSRSTPERNTTKNSCACNHKLLPWKLNSYNMTHAHTHPRTNTLTWLSGTYKIIYYSRLFLPFYYAEKWKINSAASTNFILSFFFFNFPSFLG